MENLIPQNAVIGDENTIASMDTGALADHIQAHEGFGQKGSRAQRNNNPGNLKVQGDLGTDDGGFGVFSNPKLGRQALENQVGSFQQRFPGWSPTNLAARWLGSTTGDPSQVNPHEGDVNAYGKALAPQTASSAPQQASTAAPTTSPASAAPQFEALPQGATVGEPVPQPEAIPQEATIGEPEHKSFMGKAWDAVNTPILDHFSSQPNATQNAIENLFQGKLSTAPNTTAGTANKIGSSVAAGATSPLGLLLLLGGPLSESLEGLGAAGKAASTAITVGRGVGQAGLAVTGGQAAVHGLENQNYTEAGLGALQAGLGAYGAYGDLSGVAGDLSGATSKAFDESVIKATNPSLSQMRGIGAKEVEGYLQNAHPYIENAVTAAGGKAPKDLGALNDILQTAKENAIGDYNAKFQPFKGETAETQPIADALIKRITPAMEQEAPEQAAAIRQDAASRYGGTPAGSRPETWNEFRSRNWDGTQDFGANSKNLAKQWADQSNRISVPTEAQPASMQTLEQLNNRRMWLNQQLDAYYAKNPFAQAHAMTNPDTAGMIAEANAIRNVLYDNLDRLSGAGARQANQAYGTLSTLQQATRNGMDKLALNDAKGAGSAFSSFLKREIAKAALGSGINAVTGIGGGADLKDRLIRGAGEGALLPLFLERGTAASQVEAGLKGINTTAPGGNSTLLQLLKAGTNQGIRYQKP